jgi:hypothetical protein
MSRPTFQHVATTERLAMPDASNALGRPFALIELGQADDRDELAARVEMSASGGSFGTYLSRLAGPGLIERSGRTVRLSADAMGASA